jgi:hypothetical protein
MGSVRDPRVIEMRALTLTLAMMSFATGAVAQSRPSTLAMTCGQARSVVASRGAAVLSTGQFTYDRFVSGRNFCEINETIEPVWVPTRDSPQCPIGYRCVSADLDFFDD